MCGVVCVEDLVEKQNKTTLFKVTEPSVTVILYKDEQWTVTVAATRVTCRLGSINRGGGEGRACASRLVNIDTLRIRNFHPLGGVPGGAKLVLPLLHVRGVQLPVQLLDL